MSTEPQTPTQPPQPGGSDWDKDDIDKVVDEVEGSTEERKELNEQLDERNIQIQDEIRTVGILLSASITLTALSLYSLSVGFSQGSVPLIVMATTLFVFIGYHHFRWYKTTSS